MSYYHDIKNNSILEILKALLQNGGLELRHSDGKLVTTGLRNIWETPWVHVRPSYRHNCLWWSDFMFDKIISRLPKEQRFVPLGCQECYKVVVRPKTLKKLFALEALQRRLDRPSKCGIEIRPSVPELYGGYFYNRGIEEGLECYKIVRDAIDKDPELGIDIKVILKRGCTEMEHGVGPSDKWIVTERQLNIETLIINHCIMDVPVTVQAPHMIDHVHQVWIEQAYGWGDETVLEYLDGKPLYPNYVTYHHLAEEKKEPEKKKAKR